MRQPGNTIGYVFGRKGTGKTRLAKQLAIEGLGEPLHVDSENRSGRGVNTSSAAFQNARNPLRTKKEGLWWAVLLAALQSADVSESSIGEKLAAIPPSISTADLRTRVLELVAGKKPRIFLIDGIETAFKTSEIIEYIESLFRFMSTVQSDQRLVDHVEVKLFLRMDLAKRSAHVNFEQQTEGRSIELSWDYQKTSTSCCRDCPGKPS